MGRLFLDGGFYVICGLAPVTVEIVNRGSRLTAKPRPNVVFILVDDLRWDELGCTGHPFASTPNVDRLAHEGANFRNAFASTPLCSPSRAAFLTGTYSHTNGITDNLARDALSHRLVTWPRLLHDSGYRTAFLGKWHMGNDDSPRPGFDRWVSFRGQGVYIDADFNIDGRQSHHWLHHRYPDDSRSGLRLATATRPFCLYLPTKRSTPTHNSATTASGQSDTKQCSRSIHPR